MLVGCNDAQVVVVDARSLARLGTLPRPSPIGVDLPVLAPPNAHRSGSALSSQQRSSSTSASEQPSARYADTVALAYDAVNRVLSAHYNDHSLIHWRLRSSSTTTTTSSTNFLANPNFASTLPDFALEYSRPSHTRAIWATDVCPTRCSRVSVPGQYSTLVQY